MKPPRERFESVAARCGFARGIILATLPSIREAAVGPVGEGLIRSLELASDALNVDWRTANAPDDDCYEDDCHNPASGLCVQHGRQDGGAQ